MALGFNYASGGDGSDIIPFVKYDARAGRLFRNDRTEVDGAYSNSSVDITTTFKAMMDLENIEVGFVHFVAGTPPAYMLVKFGTAMPDKPSDPKWKQGLRIMMKLDAGCGGDVSLRVTLPPSSRASTNSTPSMKSKKERTPASCPS
jgi:hypothetical protein